MYCTPLPNIDIITKFSSEKCWHPKLVRGLDIHMVNILIWTLLIMQDFNVVGIEYCLGAFTDKTVGGLCLKFSALCVSSHYHKGHVVPDWAIFWGTLRDKIWPQWSRPLSACKINLIDKYTWQKEVPSLPHVIHVLGRSPESQIDNIKPCWKQTIARTNERTSMQVT